MAFTPVTVTASYKENAGVAAVGWVRFVPTAEMQNGTDIRVPTQQVATLVAGSISIVLPATNDPGTQPVGVTYTVTEMVSGTQRTWQLSVPYTSGTLDLSSVAPALPQNPAFGYALDSSVMHLAGAETATGIKTFNNTGSLFTGSVYDVGGAVTHVRKYGATPDGIVHSDGAIASGTPNFTSASAAFTAADVGKAIGIEGAGAAGAKLVTTIAAFVSATAVTLAANAGTTVSGAARYAYGSDNTTALNNALGDYLTWATLQWGSGIYCATGTLTPPSGMSRRRLWGTGISDSGVAGGTLVLELTDNVPIWKWSSNIAQHGVDWRGMASEFLSYQGTANTNAFGCMFSTPAGGGSFFHFTSGGGLTFSKGYVGFGLDPAHIPTFWGSEMRDVQLLHCSQNFLLLDATTGCPNVKFPNLYCSNTGGPVLGAGNAIETSTVELEIDGLDLEGWQGLRLTYHTGGSNVTLRKVHIENGLCPSGGAAFQIVNASVLSIDDLSFSHAYNGGFGNVWIVNASSGGRARLAGLNLHPSNAGGNNIYLVTNDATSPVTIDGIGLATNVKVPSAPGNLGSITMVQEDRVVQAPAFSATPAPDPGLGAIFHPAAMTGAVAVANPPRGWVGARLYMVWDEDGTGGRALTYPGTNWRAGGIAAQVTTLSTRTIDEAYCIDGTVWMVTRLVTGQAV